MIRIRNILKMKYRIETVICRVKLIFE